ncbi:lysozyme inhibitor LprI family protein, partial [Yersinia enterocolitica]
MDKKNITMLKSTLVLTLSILTFNAHGASFDCSKASTQVETLICQTSALNDLDSTMANIYRSKV